MDELQRQNAKWKEARHKWFHLYVIPKKAKLCSQTDQWMPGGRVRGNDSL